MRNNALFFPNISLPNEAWTIKTLLYWDKLSSIVPMDYIEVPEKLGTFTRQLVEELLIEQIIPGQHIYKMPTFDKTFIDYIEVALSNENRSNQLISTSRIHAEKLSDIPDYLVDRGLATKRHGNWYDVESSIAQLFMTYLASCLGSLQEVNASPVTNSTKSIRSFNHKLTNINNGSVHHNKAREVVLNKLLPVPDEVVNIDDLLRFKNDHGHLLPFLRTKVESGCALIANLDNATDRLNATNEFIISCEDEIREIEDSMRPFWSKIKAGSIGGIIGSGVTFGATVANAYVEPNGLNSTVAIGAGYSLKSCVEQVIADIHSEYKSTIIARDKPLAYIVHARSGMYA